MPVGVIGIEDNKPFFRAFKPEYAGLLESLMIPVRVDETAVEGNVSISSSVIIQPNNDEWLYYMQFSLPYDISAEEIEDTFGV